MATIERDNRPQPPGPAEPMPEHFTDRWLLYLDEIDSGQLPAQPTYDGSCEECWRNKDGDGENTDDIELLATRTAQVRDFIQRHDGHDAMLYMRYEQEIADLEPSTGTVLLNNAIYRRHWLSTMTDQALRSLPNVGPKRFKEIRTQIPYSGSPEANVEPTSPQWERCPTCYGTGLKLSDAALSDAVQQVSDLATVPAPLPSIEESLLRLTTAIEEINARLAVLEKDRRLGLSTPRILMDPYEAAKAVGVRADVIWDAIKEGDIPFVRMVKGLPMMRSEALQEWLRWREVRVEPEPVPYVTPPELMCRRCGDRPYYGHSAQLKLCRECHELVKQERIEEKERKRVERLARKKPSDRQ